MYNAKYVSQELSQFSHGVVYRYGVGEGLSSALCQADFSSFNMVGFCESCPKIVNKVHIFSEGHSNLKKSPTFFLTLLNKFKNLGDFSKILALSEYLFWHFYYIYIKSIFKKFA